MIRRVCALFTCALLPISSAIAGEIQTYTYDELGRLKAVQYSGALNNGAAHSLCYDPAGNRTQYKSSAAGTLASCSAGNGGSSPPGNQPPVANPDTLTVVRCETGTKNVVANDTDPEGNTPLVLIGVNHASAWVQSSTTVGVQAPDASGSFVVPYTVRDSLGATSTGYLTVTITGTICP